MQCTAIKRERGIQRLEAMLFALDVVNTRSSGLMKSKLSKKNIRFGALIYDSCDYESYAVERALNMLLPSVDQCLPLNQGKQSSIIAGVIGSASSIVSMAIADILRLAEVIKQNFIILTSLKCHIDQINILYPLEKVIYNEFYLEIFRDNNETTLPLLILIVNLPDGE